MKKRKRAKSGQPKGQSNVFYVSRDKLCPNALLYDSNDVDFLKCKLPPQHDYACTYTLVYQESHLKVTREECGCLVYHNQYYPEFKFPECIYLDFFHHSLSPGEKLVKMSVNRCNKKEYLCEYM